MNVILINVGKRRLVGVDCTLVIEKDCQFDTVTVGSAHGADVELFVVPVLIICGEAVGQVGDEVGYVVVVGGVGFVVAVECGALIAVDGIVVVGESKVALDCGE